MRKSRLVLPPPPVDEQGLGVLEPAQVRGVCPAGPGKERVRPEENWEWPGCDGEKRSRSMCCWVRCSKLGLL